MYISIEFAAEAFGRFNRSIFGNKLPVPLFELTRAHTFLGQYKCVHDGFLGRYGHRLRFSRDYDLPQEQWEDIVIHEMIHYYIGYFKLKDSTAHGPVFRKLMDEVNRKHGRHVAVSHSASVGEGAMEPVSRKRRIHLVAVLILGDGTFAVKVLPRVLQSIQFYCTRAIQDRNITDIRLYFTQDAFFDKYPSSKALKYHLVGRGELAAHLKDGGEMEWKNGDVKPTGRHFKESDLCR